jgi:hypothetical protein
MNDVDKILILDTEYKLIPLNEEAYKKFQQEANAKLRFDGRADVRTKRIFFKDREFLSSRLPIPKEEVEPHLNKVIRHELIHCFLFESGLSTCSEIYCDEGWARNEEMVDYFAIMIPKIYKIYKELDILS